YSATNVTKIKKLLGVIAASAPFEPNISKIAQKLNLGRDTVNHYLRHLQDAYILFLANKPNRGISALQKPDKVFIENTAFVYALQSQPEIGTVRETFFINQIKNAGYQINLGKKGDFLVDGTYTFEIGGRNKNAIQIKDVDNAYLALDDIESGFGKQIPLWLFGFLY
ncbi:MAG: ATP-binding protein, partial [Fulvivirga sp.]